MPDLPNAFESMLKKVLVGKSRVILRDLSCKKSRNLAKSYATDKDFSKDNTAECSIYHKSIADIKYSKEDNTVSEKYFIEYFLPMQGF